MPSFDLDSLLNFSPPEYLCERCLALLALSPDVRVGRCPVCAVSYVPTAEFPTCGAYLESRGKRLRFADSLEHGRELAMIARQARANSPDYPPMRALLAAVAAAEQFVHVTTYGVSALLLGALKLAAQRVDVRAVVSGVKNDGIQRELTAYPEEAPRLDARLFQKDNPRFPHQKLIVVDGMLAFKGSANLTDFGWRKAATGGEVVELVTDLHEVADLHNRYFSPAWKAFDETRPSEQILMSSF